MGKSTLIYVTGTPGSGKSAVCDELKRRGYEAYDTDNDGIAFFYDNKTGIALKGHIGAEERTPAWRSQHSWVAKRETVQKLLAETESDLVLLCGVTANDTDELWDLFSKVFALVIDDEEILRSRVARRSEDGYGKNSHELEALLQWQQTAVQDYRKLGAVIIDATQPLEKVVAAILAQVIESRNRSTLR